MRMLIALMLNIPVGVCMRGVYFSCSENKSVTTKTFLCFVKNYLATRFRLIRSSLGSIKTWIKKLHVT
jgi:hypothetical protein